MLCQRVSDLCRLRKSFARLCRPPEARMQRLEVDSGDLSRADGVGYTSIDCCKPQGGKAARGSTRPRNSKRRRSKAWLPQRVGPSSPRQLHPDSRVDQGNATSHKGGDGSFGEFSEEQLAQLAQNLSRHRHDDPPYIRCRTCGRSRGCADAAPSAPGTLPDTDLSAVNHTLLMTLTGRLGQ